MLALNFSSNFHQEFGVRDCRTGDESVKYHDGGDIPLSCQICDTVYMKNYEFNIARYQPNFIRLGSSDTHFIVFYVIVGAVIIWDKMIKICIS